MDKFQEHLRDSSVDNSQWDGFDRGTLWANELGTQEVVIGRMRNELKQKVEIVDIENNGEHECYEVRINGRTVFSADCLRSRAVQVAHWWMDGCPA